MGLSWLGLKILDRYILKQLLDFFILGVVIFTLIGFFSDAFLDFVQDIQKFGISFSTALTMMGLQLPKIVALILPASCFLAVLMVYSNMNTHFEITAIRMNGISLGRLMMPAIFLGLFSTAACYYLGDFAVPFCNQQAELLKNRAIEAGTLPLGRESFTFKDYDRDHQLRQMIYIGQYDGTELKDSTIIDLTRPGVMQIVQSRSGRWYPDRWLFRNANAYTVSKESDLLFFNHAEEFVIRDLIQDSRREKKLEDKQRQMEEGLSADSSTQPFLDLFSAIQKREALGMRVMKGTYIRMWEKLALPLSCLAITLTAVPLALTPPRRGSGRGFVFAVGVLFLYYLVRSVCVNLGVTEQLTFGGLIPLEYSLLLAAWLPLVLIGSLGLFLLAQKSKML